MEVKTDNIFAAFKREPEQTQWLLRLGLAGPIAIVLWDFLASMVLPTVAVGILDLAFILAYGAAITVMIVRIMLASERWGVNAAITAKKFSSTVQNHDEPEAAPRSAVSSSFQEAHFLRRLNEQVASARRDGSHLTLVWLDVSVPGEDPSPSQIVAMETDVAELLAGQSKVIGTPLNLNVNEYVFSIPHEGKTEAREFMRKMLLGLGRYWCHCGLSEYPDDATDGEGLFARARAMCEASRQGKEAPASRPVKIAS